MRLLQKWRVHCYRLGLQHPDGNLCALYWAGLSVTPECQHCLVFNTQATLADGGSQSLLCRPHPPSLPF